PARSAAPEEGGAPLGHLVGRLQPDHLAIEGTRGGHVGDGQVGLEQPSHLGRAHAPYHPPIGPPTRPSGSGSIRSPGWRRRKSKSQPVSAWSTCSRKSRP